MLWPNDATEEVNITDSLFALTGTAAGTKPTKLNLSKSVLSLSGNTALTPISGRIYFDTGTSLYIPGTGTQFSFNPQSNDYSFELTNQTKGMSIRTFNGNIDINPGNGIDEQYATASFNVTLRGTGNFNLVTSQGKALYNGNEFATVNQIADLQSQINALK